MSASPSRALLSTLRLTFQSAWYGIRLDAKAAVTVVCTILGDLLQPVADFTFWFFVGFTVVLIGCAVKLRTWARAEERSGKAVVLERKGPPEGTRMLTAISVSGILLTLLLLIVQNRSHATQTGAIASLVPAITEMQRLVGISNQKLDGIASKLEAIQTEVAKVKPETSEDPRKELANLGISWSTQSFVEALMTGDTRAVTLFLAGGMSAETNHKGTSAVLFILQPNLPSPVPMLAVLMAKGWDPNSTLIDTYIMPHYNDRLPPHFEAPGLSPDYAAGKRTFAGPALLWIVIRATYMGANDNDRAAIAFLRKHGAETGISRTCNKAMNRMFGEFPAGLEVARLLTE